MALMPCSASVATLGASLLRLSPVTPISFSLPAATCGIMLARLVTERSVTPASAS